MVIKQVGQLSLHTWNRDAERSTTGKSWPALLPWYVNKK